ncbi:hypothetical protein LCGC14_1693140, partial [marine sediment metagenome]
MATIYERRQAGGVVYVLNYSAGGERMRRVVGSDRAEAERQLRELEEDFHVAERAGRVQTVPDSRARLRDIFGQYMQWQRDEGHALNTLQLSRRSIERFLDRTGARVVSDIGPTVGERFKQVLRAEGKLAPATINLALAHTSRMLKWAASPQRRQCETNPLEGIRHLSTMKESEEEEKDAPTEEEFRAILAASTPNVRRLWVVIAETGLRKGEAIALTWRDIDLDGRTLEVRTSTCKTRRHYKLDLSSVAVQALQEERAARLSRGSLDGLGPDGPVFVTRKGTLWRPNGVWDRLECAMRK